MTKPTRPPSPGYKRINVSVNFDVPQDASKQEVVMIFADAIAEFFMHRHPARNYVDRRYPDIPDYSWLDRDAKVASTERRLEISQRMRETVDGWHVEDVQSD